MIFNREEIRQKAQKMANENGAPVWISGNKLTGFIIHERPAEYWSTMTWIIQPEESEGKGHTRHTKLISLSGA